jgi:hypothetical protein
MDVVQELVALQAIASVTTLVLLAQAVSRVFGQFHPTVRQSERVVLPFQKVLFLEDHKE